MCEGRVVESLVLRAIEKEKREVKKNKTIVPIVEYYDYYQTQERNAHDRLLQPQLLPILLRQLQLLLLQLLLYNTIIMYTYIYMYIHIIIHYNNVYMCVHST